MNDQLQNLPPLLKRPLQWTTNDQVEGQERVSMSDPCTTPEAQQELRPSSPAGYNPYWDLPPA